MKNSGKIRLILLGSAIWCIFLVFAMRLAQIQIVDGENYLYEQQKGAVRRQVIKAARGEILDANGQPFSLNKTCYNIVLDYALAPAGNENTTIYDLIDLLKKSGESYNGSLPLVIENNRVAFTDDEKSVETLKRHLDINIYTDANDTFHWLKERYRLETPENQDVAWYTRLSNEQKQWIDNLTEAERLEIAAVRYDMERKGYSISTRYVFAEDVSLETAILIHQINNRLSNVDVVETATRDYLDGNIAPHIVGRVGSIFADELEGYLSQGRGYSRDDLVGKEGIERAYESVLRGTDGIRRIDLDTNYKVTDIFEEEPAVPGNSVVLTIDKNIQKTALNALTQQIENLNKNAPEGAGKEADAGAVVVIDIKNSQLLAAVTYPTYNLETYSADYSENAANPLYPLLNRAFSGVYAPGSCFKPVVGIGALAEGISTSNSTVNCERVYTFYPSYQPTCLGFHGHFNVIDALRHSCNIYFYDTGRQLGIEKINDYARQLGLGVPTGIELSESKGTQNNPNTDQPGDVLQAAIGQLNNGYTPVQLANYCATIARRGVRTKLSLIKSISSYYDYTDVISKPELVVESDMNLSSELFDPIFEGMIEASHDPRGTAYNYLGNYPITVASKTGTPQTREFPNSTFICFAPAEDPQIAIAVVIEKGWHGYTGAPVARAVLDSFFYPGENPIDPRYEEFSQENIQVEENVES